MEKQGKTSNIGPGGPPSGQSSSATSKEKSGASSATTSVGGGDVTPLLPGSVSNAALLDAEGEQFLFGSMAFRETVSSTKKKKHTLICGGLGTQPLLKRFVPSVSDQTLDELHAADTLKHNPSVLNFAELDATGLLTWARHPWNQLDPSLLQKSHICCNKVERLSW